MNMPEEIDTRRARSDGAQNVTARLNAVFEHHDSGLDPALAAAQSKALADDEY